MKKWLIALFLVLGLVLSSFALADSAGVEALLFDLQDEIARVSALEGDDALAQCGTSFLSALSAASDGDTVVLSGNASFTDDQVLLVGKKSVTVDLNGYTLIAPTIGRGTFTFTNGTIMDATMTGQGSTLNCTLKEDVQVYSLDGNAITIKGSGTTNLYIHGTVASLSGSGLYASSSVSKMKVNLYNRGTVYGGFAGIRFGTVEDKCTFVTTLINDGTVCGACGFCAFSEGDGSVKITGSGVISGSLAAYIDMNSATLSCKLDARTDDEVGSFVSSLPDDLRSYEGYAFILGDETSGTITSACYCDTAVTLLSTPREDSVTINCDISDPDSCNVAALRMISSTETMSLDASTVESLWKKASSGANTTKFLKKGGKLAFTLYVPMQSDSKKNIVGLETGAMYYSATGIKTKDDLQVESYESRVTPDEITDADLHSLFCDRVEDLDDSSILILDADLVSLERAEEYASATNKKRIFIDGEQHSLNSVKIGSHLGISILNASSVDDVSLSRTGRRVIPATIENSALGAITLDDCSLTLTDCSALDSSCLTFRRSEATDDINLTLNNSTVGKVFYYADDGTILNNGSIGELNIQTIKGKVKVKGSGSYGVLTFTVSKSGVVEFKGNAESLNIYSLNNYRSEVDFTGNLSGNVYVCLYGTRENIKLVGTMESSDLFIDVDDASMDLEYTTDEAYMRTLIQPYIDRINCREFTYADGSPMQLLVHGFVYEWQDGWVFVED